MSGFVPSGDPALLVDLGNADDLGRLGDALASWEPKLEIELRRGEARPYDADATGYHFVLGDGRLEVNRRSIPLAAGDLFVLPTGFAIDADPPPDVLILKHLGFPPRHHRERFLQVQGVDHLPLANLLDGDRSSASPGASGHPFHRIEFADAMRLLPGSPAIRRSVGFVLELLIVVSGEIELTCSGGARHLPAPGVALMGPGSTYLVAGQGVATIWRIPSEPEYEEKRWS